MNNKYYVVGYASTRGEFYPKGATTSKTKADKFKEQLQSQLFSNAIQWAQIKTVCAIK